MGRASTFIPCIKTPDEALSDNNVYFMVGKPELMKIRRLPLAPFRFRSQGSRDNHEGEHIFVSHWLLHAQEQFGTRQCGNFCDDGPPNLFNQNANYFLDFSGLQSYAA
jgi:hypothetical protein